jgi:parvulin-like peptidyl-prolyl isomerase
MSMRTSTSLFVILLTSAAGCSWFGSNKPKPMPAEAFFAPGNSMDPTTGRMPLTTAPSDQLIAHQRQAATRPMQTAKAGVAPHPTTGPISLGEYMTLGGVLAEVNGIPIYANRVLREIAPALSANAKVMSPTEYRNAAIDLVQRQTDVLITNELQFAEAQQNLEDRDKQLADALTTLWRQRQITEAGGSLELARQHAVQIAQANDMPDDLTFEQLVQQRYRFYMIHLWIQRKINPRAEVTQEEMRQFYNRHLADMFTIPAQAHFYLINIDPAFEGGREPALAKIRQIRQQAVHDGDFAALARKFNDSQTFKEEGGDVGWVEKDAFVLDKVEKAVWATQPGQITPIIEDRGGFYIAKVLATKGGNVQRFDTQRVQDFIARTIRGEREQQIMDKEIQLLRKNAMIQNDPDMMNSALEMAMQAYPRWSSASLR